MSAIRFLVALLLLASTALAQAGTLSSADLLWLNRVTYGANAESAARLTAIGRTAFLAEQLAASQEPALPPAVAKRVESLTLLKQPLLETLVEMRKTEQEIKKDEAGKAGEDAMLRKARYATLREARERALLYAVYSRNQVQEQMAWFWFNHFNVFHKKGQIDYMLADYEDALRPHLLGNFRALVEASLTHPAMLQYLDNTRSLKKNINENYARELLELHTLGVDGGYTQKDVQELARVLTGLRVIPLVAGNPRAVKVADGYMRKGLVEFEPKQHDFGDKQILGHDIKGRGWAEIEEVLDILVKHPATARHVARKLANYFVADTPSPALVDRLAARFSSANGDIKPVLETLFTSPEFTASLGGKFKMPWQYVVSSLRVAPGSVPLNDPQAGLAALEQLAQSSYAQSTPDGFNLAGKAWMSPAQLEARLEVARQFSWLAKKNGVLAPAKIPSLLPMLGERNRDIVEVEPDAQRQLQLLLSAPEFMYH